MTVFITYQVVKEIYCNPNTSHHITLTTTEYTSKSDVLVFLQIGSDLRVRLNNLLKCAFKEDMVLQNENFFLKKNNDQRKAKLITLSVFEEKLKQFDMNRTTIEHEIVEEYSYIDKNNHPNTVHILVTTEDDLMKAVIGFKGTEQLENFVSPIWLTEPSQ